MTKPAETELDKGGAAEEALRLYFQQLGAYVVRGAKIRAGRDHVTDIDLWVYTRASVHARHIAIVDIKNKKRAKGYERLIWLRGLQAAVGADEAIVATTATKDDLGPFAARLGVKLLSPQIFKAVVARYSNFGDRFTSEELDDMWRPIKWEGSGHLSARMETNLVELGLGLSFAALNIWIDEAAKLLTYCYDHEREPGPVARAVLLIASLVAIAADYVGKNTAFGDPESRRNYFREGLLFGSSMDGASDKYLAFAERVTTAYLDKSGASAASIRLGFQREVEHMPIGPFIDFFSRPAAGRELMDAANQLEAAAFSKALPDFASLRSEGKTIIGLLIDYAGLGRKRFLRPQADISGAPPTPTADKELNSINIADQGVSVVSVGSSDDGSARKEPPTLLI